MSWRNKVYVFRIVELFKNMFQSDLRTDVWPKIEAIQAIQAIRGELSLLSHVIWAMRFEPFESSLLIRAMRFDPFERHYVVQF